MPCLTLVISGSVIMKGPYRITFQSEIQAQISIENISEKCRCCSWPATSFMLTSSHVAHHGKQTFYLHFSCLWHKPHELWLSVILMHVCENKVGWDLLLLVYSIFPVKGKETTSSNGLNQINKYLDEVSYKMNKPKLYMYAYMIKFLSSSRCLH